LSEIKGRLTKAQREMLADLPRHHGELTMFDGNEARVASNLARKGLVSLPAGHGMVFGGFLLKVRLTDLGRSAIGSDTGDKP
jgi:hypothetical protein